MSRFWRALRKFQLEDRRQALVQHALLVGLIVIAALAVARPLGGKLLAAWTSLNGSL